MGGWQTDQPGTGALVPFPSSLIYCAAPIKVKPYAWGPAGGAVGPVFLCLAGASAGVESGGWVVYII